MKTPQIIETKDQQFFAFIKDSKKEDIIAHFTDENNKPWEYLDHDKYSSISILIYSPA